MALLKFVLTHDHMPWGWKFQTATPHTIFIRSHPNVTRTSVSTGKYRLLLSLSIGQVLKILGALWNLNMGVNGEMLKCAIKWKQLIVGRNKWKFGFQSPRNSIVGYFSCQIIWVQFGVIRCTLQNFRGLDFQTATPPVVSSNFNPTLWKVHVR